MRRVLVPLDGSQLSEAILPDARRLAGDDGELILVREAVWPSIAQDMVTISATPLHEQIDSYLQSEAEKIQDTGVTVDAHTLVLADAASAIDEAVKIFKADMIAIATHGRRPLGRLLRGGVAWKALAHSPVPVLLRHIEQGAAPTSENVRRRIMVPLDGSAFAEKALPLARELAREWDASVWLVQVVPEVRVVEAPYASVPPVSVVDESAVRDVQEYLDGLAATFECPTHTIAGYGLIIDRLLHYAEHFSITDIVMASHGRTGLTRMILGSVADELIHRLHQPIIVVPALAPVRVDQPQRKPEATAATPS
ncbi:MAG TPA: universal stress protein [Chloroflexota bacterium]